MLAPHFPASLKSRSRRELVHSSKTPLGAELRQKDGELTLKSQINWALWIYSLLTMAVTIGTTAYYLHNRKWYIRPLFARDDRYRDLTNYFDKTKHLYHAATQLGSGLPIFTYPAPAAFVYKALLHSVPSHPVAPFLAFLLICILGFSFVAWRAVLGSPVTLSATAAIVTTMVFGFPLLFDADRGNIEGVAWALAAAGLCFVLRARYGIAAVLIGLGVSIKPFSILFLLLLLRRRKYKETVLGVATTGCVVLAALVALGPNPLKAYHALRPGVSLYVERYVRAVAPPDEARFDHSLLDGFKSAAVAAEMRGIHPYKVLDREWYLITRPGGFRAARGLARIYPLIAAIGLGFVIWVFYDKPLLNQLTALAISVTLFPPSAGEYTLLHLYVPFGALLIFLARDVATGRASFAFRPMIALAVIYALLFAPLTLLMIYASDAKLLLLLALLVITARTPMRSAYFEALTADGEMQGHKELVAAPAF